MRTGGSIRTRSASATRRADGRTIARILGAWVVTLPLGAALGVADFSEIAERIAVLLKPETPSSFIDKVKKLPFVEKHCLFTRTPDGKRVQLEPPCADTAHIEEAGGVQEQDGPD